MSNKAANYFGQIYPESYNKFVPIINFLLIFKSNEALKVAYSLFQNHCW